jgi:hypothetical protein
MSLRQVFALVIAVVVGLVLIICSFSVFENLDAGQIMVIQAPWSGDLTWYTSPGVKQQWFGKVTKYDKRAQLWFSAKEKQGNEEDQSLKIRFNDGGHANISGGISWEMPTDDEHLTQIHTKFSSQRAVEQQLVNTIIEKSVYMTGPLMSSTESYAGRRNELLSLIEDQIQNGICMTKTIQQFQKDPITGVERMVSVVQLVQGKDGKPLRAEESPLTEFGVKTFNLTINEIKYEGKVEEQIQQQQQATMQVQIAIAEGKRAEQQVLTTKKEGEANAAKAEWAQKAIAAQATTEADVKKAVAETEANQKLAVATLDAKAAEQFKIAETARGEGEGARRKAVMVADGALEKKLQAWLDAQKAYAEAIGRHQGPWVPSVVLGGGQGQSITATGPQQLIELLTAKTAMDLGLDMSMKAPSSQK